MNETRPTAEERLARIKPVTLSEEQRGRLWNAIKVGIHTRPVHVASPYTVTSLFIYKKYIMVPALIVALILAGGGTVVAASDDARPGDALFAIDRATENVRIAFAGEDAKDELRVRFANERATEVESIIDEEGERTRLAMETRMQSSGSAPAEFTMQAKLVSEDAATSDDSSDDSDKDPEDNNADEGGNERIATGLSAAVEYLSDVSADFEAKGNIEAQEAIDAVVARLNSKIGGLPEDLRTRLRIEKKGNDNEIRVRLKTEDEGDDAGNEFEIRGEGVKTKVELRGGEIKIESEADDDSDDDADKDSSSASLEIEADVFTDTTIVKVERNDVKELFVTTAKTRAEVVAAIAAKFNMSEADVDAVLDFEVENRASRPEDMLLSGSVKDIEEGLDDDIGDLIGDDDSDDDGEDDSDNDNSGSGNGGGSDDEDDN